MNARQRAGKAKRWIIKIGSALITNDGRGLDQNAIQNWVAQIAILRNQGIEIVLVSSGAVAEGIQRLGWTKRPDALHKLQAAAAVGQMGVVQAYENSFQTHGLHTAQILLTHDDMRDRTRYLNARSTLCQLLSLGVIPIVNENDTVATDEIRFGDNDSLAGLVANLVEANLLVILTDQNGLYDSDPRNNPKAQLIKLGKAGDPTLNAMASDSKGILGRGGMQTKLRAAELAAHSGTNTWIAYGRETRILNRINTGDNIGTLLVPQHIPSTARKRWLLSHLNVKGQIQLDQGAIKCLQHQGASLLAVGVKQIQGQFNRGEVVCCIDEHGTEIARGLINYNASETRQIAGKTSQQIPQILGYIDEAELIHRDNLVLLKP